MGECFLYKRGSGGGGAPVLKEVEKTVFGRSLVLTDSTSKPLKGLRIFGRTTQAGTPSPDNPVPLVSPGDGGSITVEVGASSGDQNPQRLVCNTPNGLPGIPVSSGGNYADENGQQWVCDEIDFSRGKYVKRVGRKTLNGTEAWNRHGGDTSSDRGYFSFVSAGQKAYDDGTHGIFSHFTTGLGNLGTAFIGKDTIQMWIALEGDATAGGLKKWLSSNNVDVMFELASPVETDLNAEELAQYAALHTNSLYTTISNTAGADMEVTYVAIGG